MKDTVSITEKQRCVMAIRKELCDALDELENGMCRIKQTRDIWQNNLIYVLCQAVRLILIDKIKSTRNP